MGSKIDTAIEFLRKGQSFKVEELLLSISEQGSLIVTGWSQYTDLTNLNKHIALDELKGIKGVFTQMVDSSPEFTSFLEGKAVEFNLYFDSYGKGSLAICSEINGEIMWLFDFN